MLARRCRKHLPPVGREALLAACSALDIARDRGASAQLLVDELRAMMEAEAAAEREMQEAMLSVDPADLKQFARGPQMAGLAATAETAARAARAAKSAVPHAEANVRVAEAEVGRLEHLKAMAATGVILAHADRLAGEYQAHFFATGRLYDRIAGILIAAANRGAYKGEILHPARPIEAPRPDLPSLRNAAAAYNPMLVFRPNADAAVAGASEWSSVIDRLLADPLAQIPDLDEVDIPAGPGSAPAGADQGEEGR